MEPRPTLSCGILSRFMSESAASRAVELADARLQVALPLLGRLVLGVLAQVAVLAGPLDLLRELDLQLVVERPDLLLEPLLDLDHRSRNDTITACSGRLRRAAREIVTSRANPLVQRLRALLADERGAPGWRCSRARSWWRRRSPRGSRSSSAAVAPDVLEGRHADADARAWTQDGASPCACWRPDVLGVAVRGGDEPGRPGHRARARRSTRTGSSAARPLVAGRRRHPEPRQPGRAAAHGGGRGRDGRVPHRRLRGPVLLEGAARLDGQRVPRSRTCARLAAEDVSRGSPRAASASIAAAATAATPYDAMDLTGPVALPARQRGRRPAGGGRGPGRLARVAIPMAAPVESLNVAVAAGVLLFEAAAAAAPLSTRVSGYAVSMSERATTPPACSSPPMPRPTTPRAPTPRWPTACGPARSTRSSARTRRWARASRCAAPSRPTTSARSSCGARRARARRRSPTSSAAAPAATSRR